MFKVSSFPTLADSICGVFNVSSIDLSPVVLQTTSVSADVDGRGTTPDEQEADLSRFNANAASKGFSEATVDDV